MKVTYDSEADALNMQLQGGDYEESREVSEGIVIDYSKNGEIMSIEILDASKKISSEVIEDISPPKPTA